MFSVILLSSFRLSAGFVAFVAVFFLRRIASTTGLPRCLMRLDSVTSYRTNPNKTATLLAVTGTCRQLTDHLGLTFFIIMSETGGRVGGRQTDRQRQRQTARERWREGGRGRERKKGHVTVFTEKNSFVVVFLLSFDSLLVGVCFRHRCLFHRMKRVHDWSSEPPDVVLQDVVEKGKP